jgi:WD40 repeat protein
VRRVIFLPDSRTLVSVAGDNAYLWSLDKPEKPLRTFPQGSKIFSALDISRDGRLLATAGKGDDSGEGRVIKIWSIDGNEPIARPKATYNTNGAWLMSIGFSPDGCCIATSAVLTRSVGKAHGHDPFRGGWRTAGTAAGGGDRCHQIHARWKITDHG